MNVLEMAESAGLLSLNPSDLVFEASAMGIAYYDFILSAVRLDSGGFILHLAKLDSTTNLEWFERAVVTSEIMAKHQLPDSDLAMMTLGILLWKRKISQSRILCLVKALDSDSGPALEALKKAASKFKCMHHVLTLNGRRRSSLGSGRHSSPGGSTDGMRLRVMMCQSRVDLADLSSQAMRETRCLLVPSSNPILCLCFPIS